MHEHCEHKHTLRYCKVCDVVWCETCNTEWVKKVQWYTYNSPTVVYTTAGITTPEHTHSE